MRARHTKIKAIVMSCALLFVVVFMKPVSAAVDVGQAAPALMGPQLDGKPFDLAAVKGTVVVLHFWATWCPACREEMPALEEVYRHEHGNGLAVLAISGDRPRARGDVMQVMHYFTFPAAMLASLDKNEFGTPTSLPVTYIVDRKGVVRNILTPDALPLTATSLKDIVAPLLAEKADSPPVTTSETAKSDEKK